MDLKSLSFLMQSSLAYECTVCKLYFGGENQLLEHHKGSHSKRLKLSLQPEFNLAEDPEYHSNEENASSNGDSTSSTNKIVKLEHNDVKTSTENFSQNVEKIGNSDLSESSLKSLKIETGTRHSDEGSNIQASATDDEPKEPGEGIEHQCSESLQDTIEQGKYGYLSDSGFHRFSLEELKKFAVQVVALFKLDEYQHCDRLNEQGTKSDTSGTKENETPNATSSSSSSVSNMCDQNKSCYKCGEHGHFAWGCTNPRNPEIQPKRKRRSRGRKKEQ